MYIHICSHIIDNFHRTLLVYIRGNIEGYIYTHIAKYIQLLMNGGSTQHVSVVE